ncbi:hypothetical protein G3O08_04095 [Cryomorpha ignava]|uniref:Tetratricopeptide repeat protein n=1 Tax=Cryomorpha ignava TaxID=101383 RepID=A0A7K3WM14_9FLAO|nr:hypothetical protein [Cryomorpha ignava]NEN22687.1 hypothetical protein [Cryomorpha ignava]
MKNQLSVLVLFFFTLTLSAQSPTYQKAMGQAMTAFAEAQTAADFTATANTFTRIAAAGDGEYLPDYYAALSLINQSFRVKDSAERDQLADKAMEHIDAAERISPKNVELEVLRGYALTAKMVVDPSTRGQKYSPMIAQHYGKAMQMDPQNPRAAAMMARNELGVAQFFGSEPTKACALAGRSLELFENETPDGFEPRWGKDVAMEVAAACN